MAVEWNFEFRIDHLNETGEERNLKGLVYTKDGELPELEQIRAFLKDSGYNVEVKNAEQLLFIDPNPNDPIEIKIVKFGSEDPQIHDPNLKLLAEQFMKRDPLGL